MKDDCNCGEILERLFQLLDAELDDAECTRLRDHIAHCPDCTRLADAERHVRQLIQRSCVERAPERLRLRVIGQITVMRTEWRGAEGTG